jgi:hypothetical protein
MARGEERIDRVDRPSITARQPLVLALVLLPRSDHEQLLKPVGVLELAMQVPVHRPRPAASPP